MTTNRLGARLVLIIAIVATIGCDRVTKHVAATNLPTRSTLSFLADTCRLQYAENTGAFLNLGAAWPLPVRTVIFTVGNALLVIFLAFAAMRFRWSKPGQLGAALFLSGAASNVVDRIAYGRVIDFINVGIGPLRTGIFNVADVAIMVGACLFMLERYRSHSRITSAEG